jgi:hypothetical protein
MQEAMREAALLLGYQVISQHREKGKSSLLSLWLFLLYTCVLVRNYILYMYMCVFERERESGDKEGKEEGGEGRRGERERERETERLRD